MRTEEEVKTKYKETFELRYEALKENSSLRWMILDAQLNVLTWFLEKTV
jgi:hypothetical protein